DSAANSDSTLMNSQSASSPVFTSSPRPSTMCVCGVMGYAQITCGRQSATASAIAWDPSVSLSIGRLFCNLLGFLRRPHLPLRHFGGELLAYRARQGFEADDAREGGEATEQRNVRHGAPDVLARNLGRREGEDAELAQLPERAEPELVDAARAVHEHVRMRNHA